MTLNSGAAIDIVWAMTTDSLSLNQEALSLRLTGLHARLGTYLGNWVVVGGDSKCHYLQAALFAIMAGIPGRRRRMFARGPQHKSSVERPATLGEALTGLSLH